MSHYVLHLFVSGHSPITRRTVAQLERICQNEFPGRHTIEVIDVLKNPELAEQERILATPTLIRQLPLPVRRVIGHVADAEQVLMGLDLFDLDQTDHDDGGIASRPEGTV